VEAGAKTAPHISFVRVQAFAEAFPLSRIDFIHGLRRHLAASEGTAAGHDA
jgi:hypothetical protein